MIIKIAFDVDGTLIDYQGQPRHEIIAMLIAFRNSKSSIHITVHSGSGRDYADQRARQLGLIPYIDRAVAKGEEYDIAFDDERYDKAKTCIIV